MDYSRTRGLVSEILNNYGNVLRLEGQSQRARAEFERAIDGHVLAEGVLTGKYGW